MASCKSSWVKLAGTTTGWNPGLAPLDGDGSADSVADKSAGASLAAAAVPSKVENAFPVEPASAASATGFSGTSSRQASDGASDSSSDGNSDSASDSDEDEVEIASPTASSSSAAVSPSAVASLNTLSDFAASLSTDAAGTIPNNSSSLAIRYPSSFRFPMTASAASRTGGRVGIDPSCHMRWSVSVLGFDRKFSNDGRSISSISF